MKKVQRLCAATIFALVFASAMFAGEISTPGVAQPSPTPTSAMVASEIPIRASSSTSEVDVSEITALTSVALDLLQIMLSVF